MQKRIYYTFLCLLFFVPKTSFGLPYYSFENGIPSEFYVQKGNLSIENQKAKLGHHSLKWEWKAGDELIANPLYLPKASITKNGGIDVWIYNQTASNQNLEISFTEYKNNSRSTAPLYVNLNFKGWRRIYVNFREDMKHSGYTLRNMRWVAPKTGSGAILIDYLQFVDNISWERISDYQYNVINKRTELENFLFTSKIQPESALTSISEKEREAINVIKQRVDTWLLGNKTTEKHSLVTERESSFRKYVQRAIDKVPNLKLSVLSDGTVSGAGLFPMDYYNKTIDGVKTLTFREVSSTYLLQLAYDAVKNGNEISKKNYINILKWYNDQGWATGSGLGKLRFEMLRSGGFYHSVYLMRELLPYDLHDDIHEAQKWYTLFGEVYQTKEYTGENTDKIRTLMLPKLYAALMIKDEKKRGQAMREYVHYVENALSPANAYLDAIKPDFSGYHHRGVYFNAYYPDALYVASLIYYFLHDTPYTLNEETYFTLKQALFTFQFVCANYNSPAGATGRFPNQREIFQKLLPTFAYLGLSKDDPEMVKRFALLWKPEEEP